MSSRIVKRSRVNYAAKHLTVYELLNRKLRFVKLCSIRIKQIFSIWGLYLQIENDWSISFQESKSCYPDAEKMLGLNQC